MKHFYKCLISALLLVAILLPMGGCRLGDSQDQETNAQSSQGSGSPSQGSAGQTDDKYSKYSPLLQEVLADPYYDDLWRRYKDGEIGEYKGGVDSGVNLLEAIPYDFLASKEEDIEGIKDGIVAAGADWFSYKDETNNIFCQLDIIYQVQNGEKHIHQYLLQYKITEQELEDLTMLYRNRCFQGPVMFQRLASKQTPKVIADFGITKSAYEQLLSSLNRNEVVKQNFEDEVSNFIVTSFSNNAENAKNYDMTLALIHYNIYASVTGGKIANMSALVDNYSGVQYVNNLIDWTHINNRYIDVQVGASTPITYFHLSHSFKNFKI